MHPYSAPFPDPHPHPHPGTNEHWCRLDLLPDGVAARAVCACGWESSWTHDTTTATEAGLQHTVDENRTRANRGYRR
jgi:hypothetical protein